MEHIALMGLFLAFVLIMGLVERMIPLDFVIPGVKLGLSNAAIMLAMYRIRYPKLLLLAVGKCVALSLLGGGVVSFFYSLAGSLVSVSAMYLLKKTVGRHVSPVGISVVGAVCHSLGQLAVASALLGSLFAIAYMPLMIVLSGVTGVLVGILVKGALVCVEKTNLSPIRQK